MPSMLSPAPQADATNPACDLCHSRKVKCDRNNPCGNCLDADVSCQRVRTKQPQPRSKPPPKPTQDEVKKLNERVAYLEGLIQTYDMQRRVSTATSAASLDSHLAQSQDKTKTGSPNAGKLAVTEDGGLRKRSHSLGSKDEPFRKRRHLDTGLSPLEIIRPMSTPQSPSTIEVQSYIQHELEATKDLSVTRKTVLKASLEFITQLSERPKAIVGPRNSFSCGGAALQDISYPPIEFLYWMLKEISSGGMGHHVSYFLKHLSPKSLEKMGIALLHQQEDQETLLLYSICVNSIASKFLNTILLDETNAEMVEEVRSGAEKYRHSAQLAMGRIHLLSPPSLTLLQALLCSAFITQGAGDTAACWAFTSAACKTCMDLGLHVGRGDFFNRDKEDNELYYCFVWCYILDKGFSMNLGRRTCLIDTELINASEAVWEHGRIPVNLLTVYLELSRIQSVVVTDLDCKTRPHNDQSDKSSLISQLLQQMKNFREHLDAMGKTPSKFRGLYMESELRALDFSYYSVLTAILRCERANTGSKTSVGENCLEAARLAISALRSLQQSQPAGNEGTRLSFVNWTLMFYPLTPFFVLFCNVVATSNRDDFTLMRSMTDELSELAVLSTSIERLQRLFTVFLGLAEPLLDPEGSGEEGRHARQRSNGGLLTLEYGPSNKKTGKPNGTTTTTTRSTRNNAHKTEPTSDPSSHPDAAPQPPPPWDGGPYTSTFHLNDINNASTESASSASAPPTLTAATPNTLHHHHNTISPSPAPTNASASASAAAASNSYALNFSLPPEATGAVGYDMIPFWELFDVQPSLDWLDVDLGSMPGVVGVVPSSSGHQHQGGGLQVHVQGQVQGAQHGAGSGEGGGGGGGV